MGDAGRRLAWLPGRGKDVDRDELGGSEDGGLAIITDDGTLHVTGPRIASALRFLIARVQAGGQDLPSRLALTSALHGEGVTFITRSLASVIAYDGESTVAVVDLHWQRPRSEAKSARSRRKAPAPDGRPTLADAIERGASIDEIIQATTNPRLSLVSAGELPLARRPAVASGRVLEHVLGEIAERFDHVLLDLPPVLASSDALQLAQLADMYVLVVLHGVTPEHQVDAAARELSSLDSLGVIVNRFETKIPRFIRRLVEA